MLMATVIPSGQTVSVTTFPGVQLGGRPQGVVIPGGAINLSLSLFIPLSLPQMTLALWALFPLYLPGLEIPNLHLDSKLNTPIQQELQVRTEDMESKVFHF